MCRCDRHTPLGLSPFTYSFFRRFGPEATGFDLLTEFTNEIATYLIDRGFTPRAWNDGLLRSHFVTLDPRVELAWWTNWHEGMRPVAEAFTAGHNISN